MIIEYYTKNVYGKELIYIEPPHRLTILELTGKKTVSEKDIDNLEKLGLKFKRVFQK